MRKGSFLKLFTMPNIQKQTLCCMKKQGWIIESISEEGILTISYRDDKTITAIITESGKFIPQQKERQ